MDFSSVHGSSSSTLAPGSRFGNYEIVELLGAGGMGQVYRATDIRLGRQVAIKTIADERSAKADAMRRFEQEGLSGAGDGSRNSQRRC